MRVSFDHFLSPHQKSIFSTQDAKRLYSNLLANYYRLIRPVANRLDLNNFQQSVIPSVPPVPKLIMWCYKVIDLSFLQLWQTDRSHAIEAQPGKFLLFGFAFVSSSWQEIKKDFQLCWRFWLQVIGVDMRRQILTTNVWVEQVIKTYHQDFHQRRNEKIREG